MGARRRAGSAPSAGKAVVLGAAWCGATAIAMTVTWQGVSFVGAKVGDGSMPVLSPHAIDQALRTTSPSRSFERGPAPGRPEGIIGAPAAAPGPADPDRRHPSAIPGHRLAGSDGTAGGSGRPNPADRANPANQANPANPANQADPGGSGPVPAGPTSRAGRTSKDGTAPGPAGAPAPRPERSSPREVTETWQLRGGQVSASCRGTTIELLYATPADGWSMRIGDSGPARINVQFRSPSGESELDARCVSGRPSAQVEDGSRHTETSESNEGGTSDDSVAPSGSDDSTRGH